MKSLLHCLGMGCLFTLMAMTVNAQDKPEYQAPEPPPPAPAAAGQAKVSDKELNLYVQASDKVNIIQQELRLNMEKAANSDEAQKMQEQAQFNMVTAVESVGLSVQDYNRIAMLVQNDPAIREKLESLVN